MTASDPLELALRYLVTTSADDEGDAHRWLGVLAFELAGGRAAADRFVAALELPLYAPSLGGVETLVTLPALTSHAGLAPEERRALGISDGLIRVSVGIEGEEDLVADFTQALGQR